MSNLYNLFKTVSEEAAYLTGDIGQLMFPKAKRFLCKCRCRK